MLQCTCRHTGHYSTLLYNSPEKQQSIIREGTIRDVVFRDIKNTTVTQLRGVHIRDKIIKDCILLGSPLTVGMFSSRIVSCLHHSEHPQLWETDKDSPVTFRCETGETSETKSELWDWSNNVSLWGRVEAGHWSIKNHKRRSKYDSFFVRQKWDH